jgi:AraC family transcriptional regulator
MTACNFTSGAAESKELYFVSQHQLDHANHLLFRKYDGPGLSVAEYRRDRPGLGPTTKNPRSQSYMAVVKLAALSANNMWCDDRHILRPAAPAGSLALYDLRQAWSAELDEPFHTINFFVPQAAFDELSDEFRIPRLQELRFDTTRCHCDEVMLNLARAVLPGLDKPWEINRIFADHVAWAMCTHLARTYGGIGPVVPILKGGLSPAREKLAKELLDSNLNGEMSVREIANACGLSPAYFARAFRRTTGMLPHRWLLNRRVERAKHFLLQTKMSISEIAYSCGFADQSHFTRVFLQVVGTTPGAWRRARCC